MRACAPAQRRLSRLAGGAFTASQLQRGLACRICSSVQQGAAPLPAHRWRRGAQGWQPACPQPCAAAQQLHPRPGPRTPAPACCRPGCPAADGCAGRPWLLPQPVPWPGLPAPRPLVPRPQSNAQAGRQAAAGTRACPPARPCCLGPAPGTLGTSAPPRQAAGGPRAPWLPAGGPCRSRGRAGPRSCARCWVRQGPGAARWWWAAAGLRLHAPGVCERCLMLAQLQGGRRPVGMEGGLSRRQPDGLCEAPEGCAKV